MIELNNGFFNANFCFNGGTQGASNMGNISINSQTQSLGQNSVCIQQNAPIAFDSNNCLNSGISICKQCR